MAQRRSKTQSRRSNLSALGILAVASQLQEKGPDYWSEVARNLGLPDNFVNEVRRSAGDVRRSEEVEFLTRLNSEHVVDEMVKSMENAGIPDVADIIRRSQNNRFRDDRVFSIHFEVVDSVDAFFVETIGSATLEECLQPFCKDNKLSIENIQFVSDQPNGAHYNMSTLASAVQGIVKLEVTESTRKSQVTQTRYKRSRDSRAPRIYNVIMMQIGNRPKIIVGDSRQHELTSDTDDTSVYNASSDDEHSTTSSRPRTPPQGTPHRSRSPPVSRSTPPLPPRRMSKGDPTQLKFRSPSTNTLEMSDVSDGEDQPVEYENNKSLRSQFIPKEIVVAASRTKGFWDLLTDHHIRAAHKKLLERFGEKDGRFIVWQYGREKFVASVTCQGGLRHFQIVWTGNGLTVYGRGVSAPNLARLLRILPNVPLRLGSGAGEVALRSPIERIPMETESSYEEPVSHHEHEHYMDMSGGEECVTVTDVLGNRRDIVHQERVSEDGNRHVSVRL